MEKFKITFYKEPYNADHAFVQDKEGFMTTATITKSTSGTVDTFLVKLDDLGLNSQFGEFNIVKSEGFWQTSDLDSAELNLLKQNIFYGLDQFQK